MSTPTLAQCLFDFRGVLGAHADQQLLPARQTLNIHVGVLIQDMWPDDLDRRGYFRGGQQMIDDGDQAIIEVGIRVAKIFISLLKQRIEAAIDSG